MATEPSAQQAEEFSPTALACDVTVAAYLNSPAQRARVISEYWFAHNSYCFACPADHLVRAAANTKAMDFSCSDCGHRYELKTFTKRPTRSLVDGAYATLIGRIQSSSAPTLCLLERNECWQIRSLTAIHSSFLTDWIIEKRKPLSASARRAGWVGCNIRLDRIPPDGEIDVIKNGIYQPKTEVRKRFRRFLPLGGLSADQRGWTTLTLSAIRSLKRTTFSLSDVYSLESEFQAVYPNNRHIRAKMRQQLQTLRDLGNL